MRKWLGRKMMALALWLNPESHPDIKKLSIGYKIEKEDISKYQSSHTKGLSWLQAQDALIKEAVRQAQMSIIVGLRKHSLISVETKKGLTRSEVIASLYIYAPQKESLTK